MIPPTKVFDAEAESAMTVVRDVVRTIRKLRQELGAPPRERLRCEIRSSSGIPAEVRNDVRRYIEHLGNVTLVKDDF